MDTLALFIFIGLLVAAFLVVLRVTGQRVAGRIPDTAPVAGFRPKPLLNASELRLYVFLNRWVDRSRPDLHVSCQVAYGEFLGHEDYEEFRRINAKRADFVLFDETGRVHAVVEFDGAGHWGKGADARQRTIDRDGLKDAATRSAGIPLVRIGPRFSNAEIGAALAAALPEAGPRQPRELAQRSS